ncbi:MAG: GGDEF domain-containing protein [Sulfurovum sp.]|nr:GGDEF domain-containing protein [Sulfurovum sp.]
MFAQVVQKMVYLKHNSVMNSFYISILLAMASILIAIFLMRLYIDRQIAKHTIYDNDTGRYNKRFFDVELPKALARSKRHDYPFSLTFVKVDTDDKNALHVIGDLLANTVRSGDIVCRYDSHTFALLLPFTGIAGASILQSRIHKKCEENGLGISCDYHTIEYDRDLMSPEEFIQKITQI